MMKFINWGGRGDTLYHQNYVNTHTDLGLVPLHFQKIDQPIFGFTDNTGGSEKNITILVLRLIKYTCINNYLISLTNQTINYGLWSQEIVEMIVAEKNNITNSSDTCKMMEKHSLSLCGLELLLKSISYHPLIDQLQYQICFTIRNKIFLNHSHFECAIIHP